MNQEIHDTPIRRFKMRTKPMVGPTPQECRKFGLNIPNNDESVRKTDLILDSCVWATAHLGDEEPYYCLYNCGTNDLRILKNTNGEWENVRPEEINNLYGLMWKMLLKVKEE